MRIPVPIRAHAVAGIRGHSQCSVSPFRKVFFVQDIRASDNPNAVAPVPGTCAGRLPWPGLPTVFGETRVARTDLGSTVNLFVPRMEYALRFRYFCHGWALGSFQLHGYTPYSGHPMMTVLHDEWQEVGNPQVGDIAVWYETGGQHAGMPFHSAKIIATKPTITRFAIRCVRSVNTGSSRNK